MEKKLRQQCDVVAGKTNSSLSVVLARSAGSRFRELTLPPVFVTCETAPGIACLVWGSPINEKLGHTGLSPEEASKLLWS